MSSDLEFDGFDGFDEFALAQELRAAAESAAQPTPASLYAGAVDRGRRIRRTSRVKRTLAGAGALAVAAAVAVPLLGGTSPAPTVVGAASSSHAMADVSSTRTSTSTAAAATPGTDWMPTYVVQTLKSLLPAGSTTTKEADLGGISLQVFAPEVQAPGGQSLAVVRTDLETPHGKSTITLSVGKEARKSSCPSKAVAPHDICGTTPLNGGTLYVDESFKDYTHGTGAAIWSLAWNGPDGQEVYLGMSTSAQAQALTVQQAGALLSAPAWERVWKALPEPCRFGVMSNPHATRADEMEQGNMFVCATSPAAALHLPG
ncbi:hypothetical protein [Streptacidiphilus cavernicola]|uniref:PASTA domain-containing protein n=1 Tax=Streptacidiphilus cavernicola TaxID=3342716 RepID=A0ABV6W294_9ACTN